MIAELQSQMANLKKEDKNSDRRDLNSTTRSCVYDRRDASRSPRRGHRSLQRRPEERQGGNKRSHQDSRTKTNENRRFTRDQPEERRGFQHSRWSPGTTRNNRDLSYNNRSGRNNKRPHERRQEGDIPAPSENENFPQMVKLVNERWASATTPETGWICRKNFRNKWMSSSKEFDRLHRMRNSETELKNITEKYKNEVAKAVRNHLGVALYKTGEELSKMEKLDVDRAKTTASKQIQLHLRNKISGEDLQHWSKLAADLVGTHRASRR